MFSTRSFREMGLLKCKLYKWITLGPLSGGLLLPIFSPSLLQSDYVTVHTSLLLACIHSSLMLSTLPTLTKGSLLKILTHGMSPSCFLCFSFQTWPLQLLHANCLQSRHTLQLSYASACFWISDKMQEMMVDSLALESYE